MGGGWRTSLIGQQDQELEDEITFLKGCILLHAIGDQENTKEVVLNDQDLQRLNRAYPAEERRAAGFRPW
eukprot:11170737-Lingulodinium_polyedra.AAC.1